MHIDYLETAVYYPERAAYEKIAEDRAAAARDRLAIAAATDRVGCRARRTAESPLAQLRILAHTFRRLLGLRVSQPFGRQGDG